MRITKAQESLLRRAPRRRATVFDNLNTIAACLIRGWIDITEDSQIILTSHGRYMLEHHPTFFTLREDAQTIREEIKNATDR